MDDEKQTKELGVYAMEFNPKTRNITYNAPQGLNDDTCIALALSWKAFNSATSFGQYMISFSR